MKIIKLSICIASLMAIYACSGGSSTGTGLSGTAAVGAPLENALVTLKDADGTSQTVTANANGEFAFADVGALKAPFMLKAVGIVGGEEQTMFSALEDKPTAGSPGVINVTPMTHAIVAQLAPSGDPAALFSAPSTLSTVITPTAMTGAKERTVEAVKSVMQELGITNFDPFKDKFVANSTGRDKLFDLVKFQPSASGDIKIIDKASGVQTSVGKNDSVAAVTAKKLVFDPDLAKIDFSTIKTLVSAIKSAMTNKSSTEAAALMDDGFLHDGKTKLQFATNITGGTDQSILTDFVIGACDKATKICMGNATLKMTKGSISFTEVQPMPVKQQSDGSWRLYGNQQVFKYEISPMVSISTDTAVRPDPNSVSVKTEFGLSIRIEADGAPQGSTVKIYMCDAAGICPDLTANPAPSPFAELEVQANCEFVYSLKNKKCDETFRVMTSSEGDTLKPIIESGKLKMLVALKKGTAATISKEVRANLPYFSSDDVKSTISRALKTLDYSELYTTSVTLSSRVLRFGAHLSGQSQLPDYPIRLEKDLLAAARADGKISVTELCSGNSPKPGCGAVGATLQYVEQEFRDEVLPIRVALKATYPASP
jgi:hypothetical protein